MSRKHEWTERGQFYEGKDYGDDAMVLACACGDAVVVEWDYRQGIMVPGTIPERISHGDAIDKATVIELDYRRQEHGAEVALPNGQCGSRLLAYLLRKVDEGELVNCGYAERAIRDNPAFSVGVSGPSAAPAE